MKKAILMSILLAFLSGCASQGALHSAIHKDQQQKAEKLVAEKKVNPFIKNKQGISAFDLLIEKHSVENLPKWAAALYEQSHVRVVDIANRISLKTLDLDEFKELINKKDFYIDANDLKGDTLLAALVRNSADIEYIKVLLDAGAKVNTLNNEQAAPLYYAMLEERADLVELLLQANADPNQTAFEKFTPLSVSVYKGNVAIVKLLLAAGADPNKTAKSDDGALFVVTYSIKDGIRSNDLEIADLLLSHGANINAFDSYGSPLLMKAVDRNRKEIRDFLISKKIDLNATNDNKVTALIRAILKTDLDSVNALIAAKADLNTQDKDGWTPLHYAVHNNLQEIVALLIAAGADLDIAKNDGWTPLHNSIYGGNIALTEQLLTAGANPSLLNNNGWSAAHFVANSNENGERKNDAEITKLLVKHNANFNLQTKNGLSPLYLAVWNKRYEVMPELIKSNSLDINLKSNEGWTPLIQAVYEGDIESVNLLIKAGADLNAQSNTGWSALHYTANSSENGVRTHDAQIAQLLLKAGIHTKLVNKNNSDAVYLAVANNRLEVLDVLIKNKVNLDYQDEEGFTALMKAVFDGNVPAAKALVNGGANLDLQKKGGWSALHYTANSTENGVRTHDAELASLLLNKKPNLNLELPSGHTALHLAVVNNRPEVRKVLLANKANPNSQLKDSRWTPLMSAVFKGDIEGVRALIKAGANLNAQEKDGWTALHFTANSYENGNRDKDPEIARLLIEAKAKLEITTHQGRTPFATALANNRSTVQDVLLRHGAEDTRFPARPQGRAGYTTCNTRCNNGDCFRTYSDGRKLRFQAQQKYNSMSGQWEYDSGGC